MRFWSGALRTQYGNKFSLKALRRLKARPTLRRQAQHPSRPPRGSETSPPQPHEGYDGLYHHLLHLLALPAVRHGCCYCCCCRRCPARVPATPAAGSRLAASGGGGGGTRKEPWDVGGPDRSRKLGGPPSLLLHAPPPYRPGTHTLPMAVLFKNTC